MVLRLVIRVYIDGLAEPTNPGFGTYGFVIYRNGEKIEEGKGFIGKNVTNNYAEYTALIEALKRIEKLNKEEIQIFSDSRILVRQMKGEWSAKKGMYKAKLQEAKNMVSKFTKLHFFWIPREENREADKLSREAYKEYWSHLER